MDNLLLSLIVSLFWSSIFILILVIVHQMQWTQGKWGLGYCVALGIISMFRLLLPYDFGLQIVIQCPGVFSRIYAMLVLHTYNISRWKLSISDVLILIWLLVALLLLCRSVILYVCDMKKIKKNFHAIEQYDGVLGDIQKVVGRCKRQCAIYQTSKISVPMSVGIFRAYILLPVRCYEEKEISYILHHEYVHVYYGDTIWKWVSQIVCCLFWWNPFVYLLQRELCEIIEKRCDHKVVQNMNNKEKVSYLRVILKMLNDNKEADKNTLVGLAFNGEGPEKRKEKVLKTRFQLVACDASKREVKNIVKVLCSLATIIVFFISYSMVWFPVYEPPTEEFEDCYVPDQETDYIEKREDGFYYVTALGTDRVSEETVEILLESGAEIR